MEVVLQLLNALWSQDFEMLARPTTMEVLYFTLFTILFLENGFLPAAFLPGDSLLILVGVLCEKKAMVFLPSIMLFTAAASLGYWLSYVQGRWLGDTKIVRNWITRIPYQYQRRAHYLLHKHGLSALLIGRFVFFVRTMIPTIAGLSRLNTVRFQFFNWISSLLWVFILTALGYLFGKISILIQLENKLISFLILLPILLLICGIISSLFFLWRKKDRSKTDS